jgi:hypothetical protein
VKGVSNTPEELNAALARGEVNPESDTLLYHGQAIREKEGLGGEVAGGTRRVGRPRLKLASPCPWCTGSLE